MTFETFVQRHWLQFWQLRTLIHDNPCDLTINCDTGEHSQFLRCFSLKKRNFGCCETFIACFPIYLASLAHTRWNVDVLKDRPQMQPPNLRTHSESISQYESWQPMHFTTFQLPIRFCPPTPFLKTSLKNEMVSQLFLNKCVKFLTGWQELGYRGSGAARKVSALHLLWHIHKKWK